MATATREETFTLVLSAEEAQFMADLWAKIAGSPTGSRRGIADNICDAMKRVGYSWGTSPYIKGNNSAHDMSGRIEFQSPEWFQSPE